MAQRRLGVVMDPIRTITPAKDSTLAMLLEAAARGWQLHYMEMGDLRIHEGRAEATMRPLTVRDDARHWFEAGEAASRPLGELDMVLMRKDPAFDMEFLAATWVLERAEAEGTLVVNRAQSLRDANEKVFTAWFPQCTPPSLMTSSRAELLAFLARHGSIVLKPLYAMGGRSIFVVHTGDPNTNVILEEMTGHGSRYVMAQAYLPAIRDSGDKRILVIDGEPFPHAISRLPAGDDFRANIAVGGTVQAAELTARDRWLCAQVGPELRARGLHFVGLDVIGDYITEINVTSPTGIRQIDRLFGVNVAATLFDALEARLTRR
jgi:glutathione synthase